MGRTVLKIAVIAGMAVTAPFLAHAAPVLAPKNNPPELPQKAIETPPEDEDLLPLPMKEAPPLLVKQDEPRMMEALPPKLADPGSYRTDIHVSKDGTTIQLVGMITDGVSRRLNEVLRQNPNVRTLVLTSEGGILVEGSALAHIVRKHNLNTHVEFLCASACTFPLLAGKARSIAPGALIGFHQASNGFPLYAPAGTSTADEAGNLMMQAFYTKASLSQPFMDKALSTPPGDLWFPDTSMLQANSVVTRIARPAEFPMAIGEWPTSAAYISDLENDPLWAMARSGKFKHYQMAAAAGWILAASGKSKFAVTQSARSFLVRRLLSDAPAYSDDLLMEYIGTEMQIWKELGYNYNLDCDAFGLRFPVSYPLDAEQKKRQLAIFRKMIVIPADLPMPDSTARAAAQADMMEFWGQIIAEGSFSTYNVAPNFCREPRQYYEEIESLPTAERVKLLRSLLLIQSIGLRA